MSPGANIRKSPSHLLSRREILIETETAAAVSFESARLDYGDRYGRRTSVKEADVSLDPVTELLPFEFQFDCGNCDGRGVGGGHVAPRPA